MQTEMSEPSSDLELFPVIGTYVVLCIDAEMTLEALDDAQVTEAAKRMKNKFYVGYISGADRIINHDSPFQSFRVELLREGFPPRSEDDGIEPDMCIPVWPTTEHPSSRPPLQPNKQLPWTNCYHSSFESVIVRVPTTYERANSATIISPSEIGRHTTIKILDRAQATKIRNLRQPPLAEVPAEPTQSEPDNDQASVFGGSQDSLPNEPVPEDEHDSVKSAEEFAEAFLNMAQTSRPPDTMTTVDMNYDLSYVKTLPDPREFFEEEAALKKLEQDAKDSAIERARKIDEEAFGTAPPQAPATSADATKKDVEATTPWLTRTRQRLTSLLNSLLAKFQRGKARSAGPANP